MNLVIHHLSRQIRATRGLLALWLLLVLTQCVVSYLTLHPDYRVGATQNIEAKAQEIVSWWLFGVGLVLAVQGIQLESATHPRSFWNTRPIPVAVSLPGRAIFLFVIPILSSQWSTLVELTLRHGAVGIMEAPFSTQSGFLVIFGPTVIWLATYTRNLNQFFGVAGITAVSLLTVQAVLSMIRMSFHSPLPSAEESLGSDRLLLAMGIYYLGIVASLAIRYGLRRRQLAFRVALVAIVLAGLVSWFWPWKIFPAETAEDHRVAHDLYAGNTKTVAHVLTIRIHP